MQQKFRKLKLRTRKKMKKLHHFFRVLVKMTIIVVGIFFVVLFSMTKPTRIIDQLFSSSVAFDTSEYQLSEEEFIAMVTPVAKEVERTHQVRPSVLIAQAALESNWGNSTLSKESNNYFGMKDANGEKYTTNEYTDAGWETIRANFKVYPSLKASIEDYAQLLNEGTSWNPILYHGVLEAENYRDAAYAVSNAGYATDPNYAEKLIGIIEKYELYEMDREHQQILEKVKRNE